MFHSYSIEDRKLKYFASYLKNIIEEKDKAVYQNLVQPIIADAHAYANKEKDVYQISRDGFSVILHLCAENQDYFKNLDPAHLTPADYEKILLMASGQRKIALV
jgi:hypothetical protein